MNSSYVWMLVIQHHWVYPCHRMKQYCSSLGCQNSLTSGPDFLSNRRPFTILAPRVILPYTPIIKTQGVFSGSPRLQWKWSKCRQGFFHFGSFAESWEGSSPMDSKPVARLLVCKYMGIFCSLFCSLDLDNSVTSAVNLLRTSFALGCFHFVKPEDGFR